MIRKILVPALLLLSLVTFAQQGTSSPYSFYGIGDIRFKGTAENRLMGGVSVFTDSIHINLQNPASYSSLKLTSFTVGGSFNSSKFTSLSGTEKAQRSTLDYIAVGIPMGKFGAAFGLIPYSSVGYRVRTEGPGFIDGNTDAVNIIRKYRGEGGLNKAFAGVSYSFTKTFSVGADINYNFGKIETTNIFFAPGITELGTQEYDSSELSGFNFNIGAMYQRKVMKKYDFYSGVTFSPESNLKTNNSRVIGSITYIEETTSSGMDFLDTQSSKETLKMPSKFSFGVGFGQTKKWLVGAEVTLLQNSSFQNRFSDITNATFENSKKYSLGGYFVPNYNSFSNYFSKITYRAGVRYENTGLVINNESIKDYAFSAGFGLPLGGTFSNLNVGVELGRRGTAKALLVEENYANVIMSFSLNDKWFIKRRYD